LITAVGELQEDIDDIARDIVGIAERLAGLQLPQSTPPEYLAEILAEIKDAVDDLHELALEISPDCLDELETVANAIGGGA
jgi:hypothetical protein